MRNPVMQKVSLTISCAAVGLAIFNMAAKDTRIYQLEQDRDIYKSRFQNWSKIAMQQEKTISQQRDELDKLYDGMASVLDGNIKLEDAGEFLCTSYCTEKYPHICGTGTGITASGEPVAAGLTVAADQDVFPFGTVLYIEGIGIRVVQDRGADIQGQHLDVAVAGTHEDALNWDGYGEHKVWVIERADGDE